MMTPKKKTGKGVMIPKKARMAKGGTVTSKTKKASGGGVMIPSAARRSK